MKGRVFIGSEEIGWVNFKVIDESMGVIQGQLVPTEVYKKYQSRIQKLFEKKGIANVEDFDFKITINDAVLTPEGGIGITDSFEFNEIIVEAAGMTPSVIEKINQL